MHWCYYINFYIFYEAFKSFEMNFKHSSGKKEKSVETLYKKQTPEKKQYSIIYKQFKFESLLVVLTFEAIQVEGK